METNGINECIESKIVPKSKQLLTFEELYNFIASAGEVVVLGIFRDERHVSYLQNQFFDASNSLADSIQFRHLYTDSVPNIYDFELLKSLNGFSLPYILLIRPKHLWNDFETKLVIYSFGEIIDFIKINFYGLVGLRTRTTFDNLEFPLINIYLNFDYENELKNTIDFRNKILELSDEHKDIKFIISDVKTFSEELMKFYSFESMEQIIKSVPIVTAQDINQKRFLSKDKTFSIKSFSEFILNFKYEKLELKQKSFEYINSGNVKEVSAQEFDDLVFNSEKESFIMFYTKDCEYCKSLEQTIEKLGNALKGEPNVQIVKQEFITEYFAEQFKAEKFPTFYWFDRNKQKVLYYGRHDFNDFIEFIAENSIQELISFDRFGRLKYIKSEL